jgi:hypothetical protein
MGCIEAISGTDPRWPNFRPKNSNEAPKIFPLPEKFGGPNHYKMRQKVAVKWPENIFYNYLGEKA